MLIHFIILAKEEKEDEEGTISRPSSPKEGEEAGSDGGSAQVKESATLREGSARSVRIGRMLASILIGRK